MFIYVLTIDTGFKVIPVMKKIKTILRTISHKKLSQFSYLFGVLRKLISRYLAKGKGIVLKGVPILKNSNILINYKIK